ncbi:hypothetical protein LTR94_032839, partial [Friedmanniomyces endolithicus]
RVPQFGALEARLPDLAPGDRIAARSPRSQQPQWRGLPRPQRAGGEEPRQRQRARRGDRDRQCRQDGEGGPDPPHHRRPGQFRSESS